MKTSKANSIKPKQPATQQPTVCLGFMLFFVSVSGILGEDWKLNEAVNCFQFCMIFKVMIKAKKVYI